MADQKYLNSLFKGDNTAFQRFYAECRALFMAYFIKHYPNSEVPLTDLYQDSIMEFWSQIIYGKITESSLRCSLSTYVISIGINKMREGFRAIQKKGKLLEALRKHPDSYLKSGDTNIPVPVNDNRKEISNEDVRQKIEFLKAKYEDLGYPCTILLRYTWYNNMSDEKIQKAFGGYFANTDSLKSKRFKCRKSLGNMYNAWIKSQ